MNAGTEQSRHLADPVREVDLPLALARAWDGSRSAATGVSSTTLIKQPGLRVQADISVQVLSGRIRFRVGERVFVLGRGRLLAVAAGLMHDLSALEPSEVLLTLGG